MAVEDSKHFRATRPALFVLVKYLKRKRIYTKFLKNHEHYHRRSLFQRWDEDFDLKVRNFNVNVSSDTLSFNWFITKEGSTFWSTHFLMYENVLKKLEVFET